MQADRSRLEQRTNHRCFNLHCRSSNIFVCSFCHHQSSCRLVVMLIWCAWAWVEDRKNRRSKNQSFQSSSSFIGGSRVSRVSDSNSFLFFSGGGRVAGSFFPARPKQAHPAWVVAREAHSKMGYDISTQTRSAWTFYWSGPRVAVQLSSLIVVKTNTIKNFNAEGVMVDWKKRWWLVTKEKENLYIH